MTLQLEASGRTLEDIAKILEKVQRQLRSEAKSGIGFGDHGRYSYDVREADDD